MCYFSFNSAQLPVVVETYLIAYCLPVYKSTATLVLLCSYIELHWVGCVFKKLMSVLTTPFQYQRTR